MEDRRPWIIVGGIAVSALLVWWALTVSKGSRPPAVGKIGKVRVQKVDDNESLILFDFNLKNDWNHPVVVRSIEATLAAADGSAVEGHVIAERDLNNVFKNYPELGEKYNPVLTSTDTVGAHDNIDRMLCIRFDASDDTIAKRKDIVIKLEDTSGIVTVIQSK